MDNARTTAEQALARHGLTLHTFTFDDDVAPAGAAPEANAPSSVTDTAHPAATPSSAAEPTSLSERYPAMARHYQAMERGFYEKAPQGKALDQVLGTAREDGVRLIGVYPEGTDPSTTSPVGTFGDFVKDLNVGAGRMLPAWLISNVTVAPTHRRRGILRAMMTAALQDSREAGVAVAALTATEGTIYGRFGFGVASTSREISVDTRRGLDLRGPRPVGSVRQVEPAELKELGDRLYESVLTHSPGSVGRQASYRVRDTDTSRFENDGKGTGLFAVVYEDESGTPQGYLTYKFSGWETKPPTVKVGTLISATADGYRALWEYLGALDLIEKVTWGAAPEDDLLETMLVDRRLVKTTGRQDHLWLRILDLPAALRARPGGAEGSVVLQVSDPLGWTEGTWRVSSDGRDITVESITGETVDVEPEISLGIADLSGLYLGRFSAEMLRQAGVLTEHRTGAAAELGRILASDRPVHTITGF